MEKVVRLKVTDEELDELVRATEVLEKWLYLIADDKDFAATRAADTIIKVWGYLENFNTQLHEEVFVKEED